MTRCDHCKQEREDWRVTRQHGAAAVAYGVMICDVCVNAINEQLRAEAAAAREQAPKCEACGTRRGTWRVAGALMCGTCKNRCTKARNRQTAGLGAVALIGMPQVTREQAIELAREGGRR